SSVSWSPDGARILSSDFNGRVYVWRATSGDLLSTYRHGATIVNVIRWSPDGDRWASAGNDGRVLIWEGEEEQPALELTHQDSVETLEWAADGNSIAVGSDD